jgi:hypothetical protein
VTPRRDLRWPARVTVWALTINIALSATDIYRDVAHDSRSSLTGLWLILTLGTAVPFLTWFARARANTVSYGPGRVSRYREWTIAGWVCLATWFWLPYKIIAETLGASVRPAAGTPAPAGAGQARVAVLRTWWAMWLGTWLAGWSFAIVRFENGWVVHFDNGYSDLVKSRQLLELAFQVLSIGAAAGAISVVTIITRLQTRRAAEPVLPSDAVSLAGPAWPYLPTALSAALLVPVWLVSLFAQAMTAWLLSPPEVMLTRSEIVGTWRASDGATLVFYPDGWFTAARLPVDPAADGLEVSAPWSGAGQWTISPGACDGSAPGVCLTVGPSSEDGWTEGTPSSPLIDLPASPAGHYYVSDDYEFWKLR